MSQPFGGAKRRVDLSGRRLNRASPQSLVSLTKRHDKQINEVRKGTLIQRWWRRCQIRSNILQQLRAEFDKTLASLSAQQHHSGDSALSIICRLCDFFDPFVGEDMSRLSRVIKLIPDLSTLDHLYKSAIHVALHRLLSRYVRLIHQCAFFPGLIGSGTLDNGLRLAQKWTVALDGFGKLISLFQIARRAAFDRYYTVLLTKLQQISQTDRPGPVSTKIKASILDAAKAPLLSLRFYPSLLQQYGSKGTRSSTLGWSFPEEIYCTSFAISFLSKLNCSYLEFDETWSRSFASVTDCRTFSWALCLGSKFEHSASVDKSFKGLSEQDKVTLLAFVVYIHLWSPVPESDKLVAQPSFVKLVADIIANIQEESSANFLNGQPRLDYLWRFSFDKQSSLKGRAADHYDFIKSTLRELASEKRIRGLFSQEILVSVSAKISEGRPANLNHEFGTNELFYNAIKYALGISAFFSDKADSINAWLYNVYGHYLDSRNKLRRGSLVQILGSLVLETETFKSVFKDTSKVPGTVRGRLVKPTSLTSIPSSSPARDDDRRALLLLLEIYNITSKNLDDATFWASMQDENSPASDEQGTLLSRSMLADIATFLRNLTFGLYNQELEILRDHFQRIVVSSAEKNIPTSIPSLKNILFVDGNRLGKLQSLTAEVLRGLQLRDARRPFLPINLLYMDPSYFSKWNFKEVANSSHRRELKRRYQEVDEEDFDDDESHLAVPTTQVEIWLNMLEEVPFLIPFNIRVSLLRELINYDLSMRPTPRPPIGYIYSEDAGPPESPIVVLSQTTDGYSARPVAPVRRGREFDDAFRYFVGRDYDFRGRLSINFLDQFNMVEVGIDGGGVTKEFLHAALKQCIENPTGPALFRETAQHTLYPNPTIIQELVTIADSFESPGDTTAVKLKRRKKLVATAMQRYELAGLLVGKCIYDGILINYDFSGFFLNKLTIPALYTSNHRGAYRSQYDELSDIDEDFLRNLMSLKKYSGNFSELGLTFSMSVEVPDPLDKSKPKQVMEVPLVSDGASIPVTRENVEDYIRLVVDFKLNRQQKDQTTAFLTGLSRILSAEWLCMFDRTEMQLLIGGSTATIDLSDLQKHTFYSGAYSVGDDNVAHPTIDIFWRVLRSAPANIQQGLLQFATSSPRAPLLGFSQLNPTFTIRDASSDQDRLPTASTCMNLLKLPIYRDEETLRKKLFEAVQYGAGFDLS